MLSLPESQCTFFQNLACDKVCKCEGLYEHLLPTWATRSVFIWIIQIYIKIPCSRDEVNTICYPWSIRNSLLGAERNYYLYTIQTKVLIRWLFCLLRAYPNLLTPKGKQLFTKSAKICLLKAFANTLDPDQARQNVELDLDQNCLTLWSNSKKKFLKKLILKKKISRRQ